VGAGVDDQVIRAALKRGRVVLGVAEGLAQQALEAGSLDGPARPCARWRALSAVGQGVGEGEEGEGALGLLHPRAVDGLVLEVVREAAGAGERERGTRNRSIGRRTPTKACCPMRQRDVQ